MGIPSPSGGSLVSREQQIEDALRGLPGNAQYGTDAQLRWLAHLTDAGMKTEEEVWQKIDRLIHNLRIAYGAISDTQIKAPSQTPYQLPPFFLNRDAGAQLAKTIKADLLLGMMSSDLQSSEIAQRLSKTLKIKPTSLFRLHYWLTHPTSGDPMLKFDGNQHVLVYPQRNKPSPPWAEAERNAFKKAFEEMANDWWSDHIVGLNLLNGFAATFETETTGADPRSLQGTKTVDDITLTKPAAYQDIERVLRPNQPITAELNGMVERVGKASDIDRDRLQRFKPVNDLEFTNPAAHHDIERVLKPNQPTTATSELNGIVERIRKAMSCPGMGDRDGSKDRDMISVQHGLS